MGKSTIAKAVLLVVLTLIVYIPAMPAQTIWDDDNMVFDNPLIHPDSGLKYIWLSKKAPDYWPLTYTTFWLEWRLWRKNPTGYQVAKIIPARAGQRGDMARVGSTLAAGCVGGGGHLRSASGSGRIGCLDR